MVHMYYFVLFGAKSSTRRHGTREVGAKGRDGAGGSSTYWGALRSGRGVGKDVGLAHIAVCPLVGLRQLFDAVTVPFHRLLQLQEC